MQKKIIALAVAAVASSAAFAQSNVTVYGVMDMYAANVGAGNYSAGGLKASVLNSGGLAGSRIGFKGVEDLGGGTSALFTLEYQLGLDRNDTLAYNSQNAYSGGGTQTRQAFVGLTGAYGTAIAGRLQTLAYNHNAAFNPTFGTAADTQASVVGGLNDQTTSNVYAGSQLAIATAERLENAIAYVAPKIGDVTLAAAHSSNAVGTDTAKYSASTTLRASEVSASYANGPLAIGGVYRQVTDNGAILNANRSSALGASYDFGVAKLFANTAVAKDGSVNANAVSYTLHSVGVVAPVSAHGAVIASIASGKNDAASANERKATTSAILYKHELSKRTSLYGGVAKAEGDAHTSATLAGVASTAQADGKSNVAVALVGINHSF